MRPISLTLKSLAVLVATTAVWGQAPEPDAAVNPFEEEVVQPAAFEKPTTPPSRFTRARADGRPAGRDVPGIKNYHDELFREFDAPRSADAPRENAPREDGPRVTEQPSRVQPAGGPIRRVDFKDFNLDGNRDVELGDAPIGGKDDKGVVTAGFDDDDPKPAGRIQQVDGERGIRPASLDVTPAVGGPAAASVGPQSPSLELEWVKKTDVNVGQECIVDLRVKNNGQITAYDVVVEAFFPRTLRLLATEPKAAENRTSLSWSFPRINTEETKTIRVKFVPSQRGDLATRANVRFTGAAATTFTVEEPMIALKIDGPREVHLGEPASQIVTVSNPGTGVARNVILEARLPEGLEHPRGTKLVTEIGALNPGEKRQVRLALSAVTGGNQIVLVSAAADGNLEEGTKASVNVVAPSLSIGVLGPKLRYLGRAAAYRITVVNDGTAPTDNVRVVHQVPEGFEFVSASRGGKYSETTRQISWFVGRIDTGKSHVLAAQLQPNRTGKFDQRVGAISEQGARAEASASTRVESASELVLEIVDLDDPVEIGVETAYEVRVRNDGSKAASNVAVSCELPPGVQLVDARGPTQHAIDRTNVVFKSIPTLAPGKTALYRVTVKGTTDGNHRFRAKLASDAIKELIIEELTKFYGE